MKIGGIITLFYYWPPSWIFRNPILFTIIANFTEINRKHVFAASTRNIIENRV